MPGYDYRFVTSVSSCFLCPICVLPMKEPVQITSCGHKFCDSCLQEYLSEGVFNCPEDHLPLDYAKIYPDPNSQNTIMSAIIHCIHYDEGCQWMDSLRKLRGHLNVCKYDSLPCTNKCAAQIPRVLMDDHLTYTCPKRKVNCEYCCHQFTGEMLEGHAGSCLYEPVYCENKCGSKLQKRFLNNHRMNECPKRLVPCAYCLKEFVCETLQSHTLKCPRLPLSCPNRCESPKIPREDMDVHLKKCPSVITSCVYGSVGCKFKGPRYTVEKHIEDNDRCHLKLMCNVVAKQQVQISTLKSALHNLNVNTSGTLIWKINDYSNKMAEASNKEGYELCSTPFYTSQYGYKLMATLFLNGNGAGEGTHFSIYIKIIPGDYDALLRWPFSHTVSFVLFDQGSNPENACNIIESFVPDPTWKNFQRPSKDPETLGFGFPRFVSHETLRRRNYIKDDTVFIKVKVDPSNIIAV
ncbi:TRAF4 (predicted) [Pycnogonum litorale]